MSQPQQNSFAWCNICRLFHQDTVSCAQWRRMLQSAQPSLHLMQPQQQAPAIPPSPYAPFPPQAYGQPPPSPYTQQPLQYGQLQAVPYAPAPTHQHAPWPATQYQQTTSALPPRPPPVIADATAFTGQGVLPVQPGTIDTRQGRKNRQPYKSRKQRDNEKAGRHNAKKKDDEAARVKKQLDDITQTMALRDAADAEKEAKAAAKKLKAEEERKSKKAAAAVKKQIDEAVAAGAQASDAKIEALETAAKLEASRVKKEKAEHTVAIDSIRREFTAGSERTTRGVHTYVQNAGQEFGRRLQNVEQAVVEQAVVEDRQMITSFASMDSVRRETRAVIDNVLVVADARQASAQRALTMQMTCSGPQEVLPRAYIDFWNVTIRDITAFRTKVASMRNGIEALIANPAINDADIPGDARGWIADRIVAIEGEFRSNLALLAGYTQRHLPSYTQDNLPFLVAPSDQGLLQPFIVAANRRIESGQEPDQEAEAPIENSALALWQQVVPEESRAPSTRQLEAPKDGNTKNENVD